MRIFRKDGNVNQRRQRNDQNALVRSEQQPLARDLYQRDPFQLMRDMMMIDPMRMFQQMAPWADRGVQDLMWNPSFEVQETDDAFILKGDMPGVKQQDLEISLIGNSVEVSGKRERETEHDEGTMHTYERSYGEFSRSFPLPETADMDKVRCDLKEGVLTMVIPKKAGTAPLRRKIQIGSGSKA